MVKNKSNTCAAVIFTGGLEGDFPSRTPLVMQPLSGQPVIIYAVKLAQEATGFPATLILD